MIFTVLFYIFVAVTVMQLCYYLSFLSFGFSSSKKKTTETIPVSVIVCAKNEADNLEKLIPLLLNQTHSNFELVLINDASTDSTADVLTSFAKRDQRIKLVNVENNEAFWGNKKYALTLGIKAAKHEHLLFTDADCIPSSNNWIQLMSQNFTQKKSIVLGYGKYDTKKFSLTHLLVKYETLLTAIQYFSYAKMGIPYMGVGRNLAYTKSEFFKVKGFINHLHIKSGDDDLFVRDAATGANTSIQFHPESFTISNSPKNLAALFRQKRRHISTAKEYKFLHQFLLSCFFITKIFMFGLFFALLFSPYLLWSLIGFGSYFIISYICIALAANKLKETRVLFFLPFLEVFLMLFQFAIFIANSITKPTHWK